MELSANSGVSVSKLAAGGAGVWMSFSRTATLELYNAVTRICLQQIDIGATLNRLITSTSCLLPCCTGGVGGLGGRDLF